MSGAGGGAGLEQGRRMLAWLETNRTRLALALGVTWVLGVGAIAYRVSAAGDPSQQRQQQQQLERWPPGAERRALGQALEEQERKAREQRAREVRWQQEDRHEREVQRDEQLDGWRR